MSGDFILELIESVPAPIFFKARSGKYLGGNRAFENFIALPRERFVGRTVYDISPHDLAEKYFRADQALFLIGGIQIYEAKVCNAEGKTRKVIFNKAVFTMPDGSVGGLVGVILDITEHEGSSSNIGPWGYISEKNREIDFLQLLAPHLHLSLTSRQDVDGKELKKPLTRREQEILKWMCGGKTNSEIASILGISSWTVKIHVSKCTYKIKCFKP